MPLQAVCFQNYPWKQTYGALSELWMDAYSAIIAPSDSVIRVEKAKNSVQKRSVSTSRGEDKGVNEKPFSSYIKNSVVMS